MSLAAASFFGGGAHASATGATPPLPTLPTTLSSIPMPVGPTLPSSIPNGLHLATVTAVDSPQSATIMIGDRGMHYCFLVRDVDAGMLYDQTEVLAYSYGGRIIDLRTL